MRVDAIRKARTDSWWAGLPEEECWEIFEKRRRHPWHAVVKWLAQEKGLEVSRSGLDRFEAWMRPQVATRRVELAVLARNEAKDLAAAAGAGKDVANAFLAMGSEIALRTEDPEAARQWLEMFAAVVKAAQKDTELRLREESQRLDREKFEAQEKREAAAKGALSDKAMTDEERMARLKDIFGIG